MEFSKWKITERNGKFREGGNWRQQVRIRTSMMIGGTGCFLEEGIILSDWNTDSQGNKSQNTHKGYHYISLMRLNQQTYFAFNHKRGWRVLSDDALTYVKDYKTKKEAVTDLIKKAYKIGEAKIHLN
jgi:hypothetical protein